MRHIGKIWNLTRAVDPSQIEAITRKWGLHETNPGDDWITGKQSEQSKEENDERSDVYPTTKTEERPCAVEKGVENWVRIVKGIIQVGVLCIP